LSRQSKRAESATALRVRAGWIRSRNSLTRARAF